MALQFWLLIKYGWSWRRPASLNRQDLTRHRRRLGRTIQNPSKIWLKKEKKVPSYCSRLCCILCRLYLSMLLCKVRREREAASGLQGLRRGRLLFSSLLLPLTWRWGFSSFTLSPLQQQTWPASCDQTKLSSSPLFLSFSHQLEGFSSRMPQINKPPPLQCRGWTPLQQQSSTATFWPQPRHRPDLTASTQWKHVQINYGIQKRSLINLN